MTSEEKLSRALSTPWEFVGEPHVLLQLLRAECLRLREEERQLLDEIAYLKAEIQSAAPNQ